MLLEGNGLLDTYLLCQALGWEWNLTSIFILVGIPIIIVFVVGFLIMWREG